MRSAARSFQPAGAALHTGLPRTDENRIRPRPGGAVTGEPSRSVAACWSTPYTGDRPARQNGAVERSAARAMAEERS
ncbi:hypothetical protein ACFH04_01015 [Streptomyces noboritoensis]|uniref:Uncharacterized protein n=1 Tax=Streptomyces noboritoensis TaxID=67337 RepID=A0ABV6T955_9ACTN